MIRIGMKKFGIAPFDSVISGDPSFEIAKFSRRSRLAREASSERGGKSREEKRRDRIAAVYNLSLYFRHFAVVLPAAVAAAIRLSPRSSQRGEARRGGPLSPTPSRRAVTAAARLYKFYIIFMRHKVAEKPAKRCARAGSRLSRRASRAELSHVAGRSEVRPLGEHARACKKGESREGIDVTVSRGRA